MNITREQALEVAKLMCRPRDMIEPQPPESEIQKAVRFLLGCYGQPDPNYLSGNSSYSTEKTKLFGEFIIAIGKHIVAEASDNKEGA